MLRLLLITTLLFPVYVAAQSADPLASASLQGMSLVEVLRRYADAGVDIQYSRQTVRRRMRVGNEPPSGDRLMRLRAVLAEHGLRLQRGATGRWLVLRQAAVDRALVQGRVIDAQTGRAVRDATVLIAGLTAATDRRGHFVLALPARIERSAREVTVTIAKPGYTPATRTTPIPRGDLRITLVRTAPVIEELLVTSSRYRLKAENESAARELREDELNRLPEVGDDALRAALHLPGVATLGLSAKPHIRGGLRDETLILFDSVELLEPFHLTDFQSLFSGLNPALIRSIDVYTGGFPARYGDRMSGVMDIKPVTDFTEFGGEAMLSVLTSSLELHGPFGGGRGDWALSARRGNLDLVTDVLNPDVGEPRYSDWFAQFTTQLDPSSELSGTFVYYDDDVLFTDGEPAFDGAALVDGELARSRYRNAYGWLKWGKDFTEQLEGTTVLSFGSIRHNRGGEIVDDEADDSNAFSSDRRRFDLYGVQQIMRYVPRRGREYELGLRLAYQRARYDYLARVDRGELAQAIGINSEIERRLALRPEGFSGGGYLSAVTDVAPRLTLETGLRWDFQSYGNRSDQHVSPRFSVRFDPTLNTTLRASVGRFYQPEAIHELQIIDGVSAFQAPQRADHYILALTHDFGQSGLRLRAEAFSKSIRNPKFRFENLFDPLVLLPELASDRILLAPERARARGFEISLGYVRKRLSSFFSYTYSEADDRIAGRWEARSWDQRHTFSSGLFVDAGRWTLSASVLWHSGWPTTQLPPVIGALGAAEGDDDEPGIETLMLTRNTTNLPNYLSVDLRAEREWRRGRHTFAVFAELTNALNHKNIGALEVDLDEDEENGGFIVTREPKAVLPWVPALGFRWKF